jgi:hypothetical protein
LVLLFVHFDFLVGVFLLVLLIYQLAHILIVDVNLVVIFVVEVIFILLNVALHHVVFVLTDLILFTFHGFTVVIDDPVHLLTVSLVFLFHLTTFTILILAVIHNFSLVVFVFLLLDEHFVLVKGNSLISLQAFFVIILILDFTFALVTHFSLFIDLVHVVAVLVIHAGVLAFRSLIVRLLVEVILSVDGITLHEHDVLLFGEVLSRVASTLDNLLAEVLELLVLVHEQVDLLELGLTLSVQSLNKKRTLSN